MSIGDLEAIEDFRGWRLVLSLAPRRPLTPRERQIVDLVTHGRSQKEIAFELGVSNVTVRVLYSRAMRKLGRSRAAPA